MSTAPFHAIESKAMESSLEPSRANLVVLVHGLGSKRLWMRYLEYGFRQQGYRVAPWSYSSWTRSVDDHGRVLAQYLIDEHSHEPCIDIVAHSMGSIVVRAAMQLDTIKNLGRMVFLAPPNRGSPVARWVSRLTAGRLQTVADISSDPKSFVNQLPDWGNAEVAVIASRFDFLVPVARTCIGNTTPHAIVPHSHNSILFSRSVVHRAAGFLRTGELRTV